MMERRLPRLTMPRRGWENEPVIERLLHAVGARPDFVDAVLGDLAEERARRVDEDGPMSAQWWYAREALRSVPHLAWSAVRHGGPRGLARVTVLVAVLAVPPAVVAVLLLRDAPPASLVFEGQRGSDMANGVVLNTTHPIQLVTRVLDAKQRELPATTVRYRWTAGTPVPVTSAGVVTCTKSGDAEVRASVGAVATTLIVRCRPVNEIHGDMVLSLIAGGPGQTLPFTAYAPNGRSVDLVAWEARVQDTSVATLDGLYLRPIAPGTTGVTLNIGDARTHIWVSVYEPVRTLAGLRPDQRLVSAPVHLDSGDTIRWPLPTGSFWLRFTPAARAQPVPKIAVHGQIDCMPAFGPTDQASCVARDSGAWVRITNPRASRRPIVGNLALERRDR
jgi:hypothetical protein